MTSCFYLVRVFLCCQGWPPVCKDPPALAFQMLGSQVCVTLAPVWLQREGKDGLGFWRGDIPSSESQVARTSLITFAPPPQEEQDVLRAVLQELRAGYRLASALWSCLRRDSYEKPAEAQVGPIIPRTE